MHTCSLRNPYSLLSTYLPIPQSKLRHQNRSRIFIECCQIKGVHACRATYCKSSRSRIFLTCISMPLILRVHLSQHSQHEPRSALPWRYLRSWHTKQMRFWGAVRTSELVWNGDSTVPGLLRKQLVCSSSGTNRVHESFLSFVIFWLHQLGPSTRCLELPKS